MKNLLIDSTIFSEKDLNFVIDEYFSNWVSSIYYAGRYIFIDKFHKEPTSDEALKIFLALFKRMIDEGLILAGAPINGEPEKEIQGDQFWDVSSDRMIEYIRSVLPSDPEFLYGGLDDKDDEWGKFWYGKCPQIRWVDKETGQIY